ncbi:MAG: SGNH/GDSL hydrolase family protein, partial [Candidatus Eremiobacterota bacterium]
MERCDLYVALGDSLTIDKFAGPGLGAAALLHKNRSHPEFAGRDLCSLNPDTRFVDLARDGLTSVELLGMLDRLPEPRPGTLVTLTIGGNDLIAALNAGLPEAGVSEFRSRVDAILRRVTAGYPDLRLLIGNIYDPTDGTGQVQSGHRRFASGLPWLSGYNRVLAELAERHGGTAVDIHAHFRGHGMRHSDPT